MNGNAWVRRVVIPFFIALAVAGVGMRGAAQTDFPRPDPKLTGFDNQTNGFEEQGKENDPDRDRATFLNDKAKFDEVEQVLAKGEDHGGLGPVYNSTACVNCHQNAGFVDVGNPSPMRDSGAVSGTSSQVSEIRAGHLQGDQFVEPPGGSLFQQRAIDPRIQVRVPVREDKRTLRMATSTLGDGLVEFIRDEDIIAEQNQQHQNDPDLEGKANPVKVVVEPIIEQGKVVDFVFTTRFGRFGWKCQEASLLNFSAGAYVAEMGITSPLQLIENTSLGRPVDAFDRVPAADPKEPEDPAILSADPEKNHPFGADVEGFARFMRSTKAPPPAAEVPSATVVEGRQLFLEVGCGKCHREEWTTAADGTRFGDVTIPIGKGLGGKKFFPYSDFLLHDIGTGDDIVQMQFSNFPPTGLALRDRSPAAVEREKREGKVRVIYDLDRINSLLNGEPDPVLRARGRESLRESVRKTGVLSLREKGLPVRALLQVRGVVGAQRVEAARVGKVAGTSLMMTTTTAKRIRTAPLWGLRTRPQLLHNGLALTLEEAIAAHQQQAEKVRMKFDALTPDKKLKVLEFLNFL